MSAIFEVHTHGEKVVADFMDHLSFGVLHLSVGGTKIKVFVESADDAEDLASEIAYAVKTMRHK